VQPTLRRLPHIWSTSSTDAPEVTRETHYFERTHVRAAALIAYPFDHARRLEFEAGALHTAYRRTVSTVVRSLSDGRLLSHDMTEAAAEESSTGGEATAAYVRDTAVFGPTSPILGARARFEVTKVFGDLSATRVLVDYRRYMMPRKPYTVAVRGVHLGQYGRDAGDPRVLPTFLGSRQFLRGYGWGTIRCELNADGACGGFDELLGRRLLVANLEVRAPLLGIASRDLQYGPVPAEAFLFADSGLVWARAAEFAAGGRRRLVRSFGAGVRVNAFGLPLELAVVRAVDPPAPGWTFDVAFRSGF
jgi:hypothetical protein